MALSFHVSHAQLRDWKTISEMTEPDFPTIVAKVLDTGSRSPRASKLLADVENASGDSNFAKVLCRQLLSLSAFRRARRIDPEDAVQALLLSFDKNEVGEDVCAWLVEQKDALTTLMESENIRLPAKSLQLSTDHDKIYASGNIITDIRPVFDGGRDEVHGGIVIQTMRLHYFENGEDRDVSFALDSDDIENLIAELTKAKNKANVCRLALNEKLGVDTFVVGEESYGFE